MSLLDSVSINQTSNQANATGVLSSQTNPAHNSPLYTSLKIAGVFICVVLCALIIVSAQASSKEANAEFNAANKTAAASIDLGVSPEDTATTGPTDSKTSSPGESANLSNDNTSSVKVTVNGEPTVDVPSGGNYTKTVSDPNGTSTVTVKNSGNANNSSFTSSSTYISSNSSSFSSDSGSQFNNYSYTGH